MPCRAGYFCFAALPNYVWAKAGKKKRASETSGIDLV